MGQYVQTLQPGLHVLILLFDRIAYRHTLAIQREELSDVYETKDRRQVTLKSAIRFRILDAKLASYGAVDYLGYLRAAIGTAQKKHVEGHDWESPREDTRSIGSEVSQNIDAFAAAIGVKVVEYEVRDMELGN